MCGRYSLSGGLDEISSLFEISDVRIEPRFNIAPTQEVPAVAAGRDGHRRLEHFRWGLIPYWAQDPRIGARMINARCETVADKAAFRRAFQKRRCLIPASGYLEWLKRPDGKQPILFSLLDSPLFALAGLWEYWRPEGDEGILSCAILTTDANRINSAVHDRMPVILDASDYQTWLDPSVDPQHLGVLLRPYPSRRMTATPVSRRVNNVRYDDPECLTPVELDSPFSSSQPRTLFD